MGLAGTTFFFICTCKGFIAEISRLAGITLYFEVRILMRCQVLLVMASREDVRKNRRFSLPSQEKMEKDSGTAEHRLFEGLASRITQVQVLGQAR